MFSVLKGCISISQFKIKVKTLIKISYCFATIIKEVNLTGNVSQFLPDNRNLIKAFDFEHNEEAELVAVD